MIADFDPDAAWFQFLGRLHPLVLHLPIGLWVGVAFVEFGGALLRRTPSRATVASLAWLAALGGAMAAGSGWILAMRGGYDHAIVDKHRWLGVAVASTGLLAAIFAGMQSRKAFRMLLLFVLGTMLPAGHLGASLTHGEDFLTKDLEPRQPVAKPNTPPISANGGTNHGANNSIGAQANLLGNGGTPQQPNGQQPTGQLPGAVAVGPTFASAVLPILERTCTQCHGKSKQKADLRLDAREGIDAGGENGAVVVAGKPDESSLLTRVLLPLDHKDHMPKKGKPQPTEAEIATLRAWIAAGAPFDGAFGASKSDAPKQDAPGVPAKLDPPTNAPTKVDAPKNDALKNSAAPPTKPSTEPKPANAGGQLVELTPPTIVDREQLPQAGAPKANSEPAKTEPAKIEPAKATLTSNDAPKPAAAPSVATPAATKPDAAKPEATQPEATKPVAKPEAAPPTPAPQNQAPATNAAAVAALKAAFVHVQDPPPGGTGLWVDFAAIAQAMTEAQARSLLTPLCGSIQDLGLARVPVGDDLCALLAKMPLLERIDLRGTAVTSKGVAMLAPLPKLKELVLAQTKLDDSAVDALLAMPMLTKVFVWNAGLSADALTKLRGKQGLTVDAGDAPKAKALETEGELKFVNDLPVAGAAQQATGAAPAADAAKVAAEVAAALKPINDVCPVSGKPVDPRFVVVHDNKAIGFCCMNCPKTFWTEPAKFPVKPR